MASTPVRAVLLDAMGTLVALDDPVSALRRELSDRFGLEVGADDARDALGAEIAFYRANHLMARDEATLEGLRERCTGVLARGLGPSALDLPEGELKAALLCALRFTALSDAATALSRLRALGMTLVVVSNWDVSLGAVLDDLGLADHLDGVLTSAQAGAAKPDRAIFDQALALAGVSADQAVHVGDSLREDVDGARGAGIAAVLLRRSPGIESAPGVPAVGSLLELEGLLGLAL